jgi:EmrB/QacA subfamily drug resistance transporter
VLVVVCAGQLMILLDATAVNVVLPVIQRELHFSQSSIAWVVNAYLLTFGGLLLLAGRAGDLLGRKRIFHVGLCGFVLTSLLCGLARSPELLVAGRFLQGASAAMTAAMVLGLISPMFPEPRDRATALSIFSAVAMAGASLGLVLGGAINDALNWHWIFIINVPIGAVVLLLGRQLIDDHPGLGLGAGADLWGAVLVTAAPVLAVYGVINAGNAGWLAPSTLAALIGSLVLAVAFVAVEARARTPLTPLRIFRNKNLVVATLLRIILPFGGIGLLFLLSLYSAQVLGYSPLRTGLALLPNSVVVGVISLGVLPRLVHRVKLKMLVVVGFALISGSLFYLGHIGDHSNFLTVVLPATVLNGIGVGLVFMPTVSLVMTDVEVADAGVVSGLINVAPQMGASFGVALLATISSSRSADLLAAHIDRSSALAGGYRLGFLVGGACLGLGVILAGVLLRSPLDARRGVRLAPTKRVAGRERAEESERRPLRQG